MRKTLLFFGCAALCLILAHARPPAEQFAGDLERLQQRRDLEREIQIVNLINGLYLTEEQTAKLLPVIKEAAALKDRRDTEQALAQRELIDIYRTLKEELLKCVDATSDTKKRYGAVHAREKAQEEGYAAGRKALVERVKEILSENQRIVTQEYSPCLIPLRSMVNPARIGQAGDSSEVERLLREMRNRRVALPQFLKMKQKFLEGARVKLEEKLPKDELGEELARMDKTLEEARVMADVDFELQKEQLIERLHPKEPPVKYVSILESHIGSFILDPRAIPVLLYRSASSQGRRELRGKVSSP